MINLIRKAFIAAASEVLTTEMNRLRMTPKELKGWHEARKTYAFTFPMMTRSEYLEWFC